MLLSRKWLDEFVHVDANDKDFAEAMTLSGSKVETVTALDESLKNVVVGKILSMEKHPDSDHMWVCQIDVGREEPVQIVTGAWNVHIDDLVPVAMHKSTLPGGKKIEKGKLRGVVSNGMLCGLSELGLDDHVVEFEITPNRPDCLSIIGLAREASATFDAPLALNQPVVKGGGPGVLPELLDVETPAADLCPRYTARMVRNVKIAPSPKWMRERLRAMGVRPINNIVDITNYVMLEYGQPMHAFDYRYVKGGKIVVRRAEEGEELTTLDGSVRKLNPNMLVIADEHRAVGLAGIMGGENSEIVADTADVVFESANFDGTCIRKGALALGMRTEASAKFEKGLDPMNTLPAVDRACELVELLGAGACKCTERRSYQQFPALLHQLSASGLYIHIQVASRRLGMTAAAKGLGDLRRVHALKGAQRGFTCAVRLLPNGNAHFHALNLAGQGSQALCLLLVGAG